MQNVKVTIRPKNNGFECDYKLPDGKRMRPTFKTENDALDHKDELEKQYNNFGVAGMEWPTEFRSEWTAVGYQLVKENLSPWVVLNTYREAMRVKPVKAATTAKQAFDDFMKEQDTARHSKRTLKAYKSNVGRFISGREAMPMAQITRSDVLEYLGNEEWGPRTFNTYHTSLNTFFVWCKDLGYVAEAVTETIKKIDESKMGDLDEEPTIFTIGQTADLLKATLTTDPGLVPYVALGLFGGLRPEREAAKTTDKQFENGCVKVLASLAKDRNARYVNFTHKTHLDGTPYTVDTLKVWIDRGGEMAPKNLRRRFEDVRAAAGLIRRENVEGCARPRIVWTGWDQDVMRHTFASHYLPLFGADATIRQLGHGDHTMLFNHYRALVHDDLAKLYWQLTPDVVKDEKKLAELIAKAAPLEKRITQSS